eukprot:XP_001701758.1 predicted protein [Chlamydomonas reinhardtii]
MTAEQLATATPAGVKLHGELCGCYCRAAAPTRRLAGRRLGHGVDVMLQHLPPRPACRHSLADHPPRSMPGGPGTVAHLAPQPLAATSNTPAEWRRRKNQLKTRQQEAQAQASDWKASEQPPGSRRRGPDNGEGFLLFPGQHGITYKPALLPEDAAGGSTFSSEGDENTLGPLDRRSSFQLDDGSVTADCSYSSSSTFWLGSTAGSVRSRPASVFFGAGDVPSTPSGLGDAFLAQSPCYSAKLVAGHPAGAFSRRSGEYAAHTAGSYSLVSHTSAACTLGPLLEDLPTQPCAVRRTTRAARLESRLREQRGAMEDLQRQLGEREGQLASLRAESHQSATELRRRTDAAHRALLADGHGSL